MDKMCHWLRKQSVAQFHFQIFALRVCVYFRIVKQETLRAQQTSPDRGRTNGCVETRPMDILELLSKAKEEYHRVMLHIALV